MSARDRDRLKVLHEVVRGHLPQRQAGEQLGITDRWVQTLLGRLRKEGDGGLLHRLRGLWGEIRQRLGQARTQLPSDLGLVLLQINSYRTNSLREKLDGPGPLVLEPLAATVRLSRLHHLQPSTQAREGRLALRRIGCARAQSLSLAARGAEVLSLISPDVSCCSSWARYVRGGRPTRLPLARAFACPL